MLSNLGSVDLVLPFPSPQKKKKNKRSNEEYQNFQGPINVKSS